MSNEELQLLAKACNTEILNLITKKIIPNEKEWETFTSLKNIFEKGTPLPYILGHKEFFGIPFTVTPATLIPREETETLVEEVLKTIQSNTLLIDIGTGSGCIAIAITKTKPELTVLATDISAEALNIATQNAKSQNAAIQFFHGNLLEPIPKNLLLPFTEIYITANLPYIPENEWNELPINVQQEPKNALLGGPDGLYFFKELLDQILKNIPNKKITIFFEHTTTQHEQLTEEIKKRFKNASCELVRDIYQNPRITIAKI